jgi:hypothetical protein
LVTRHRECVNAACERQHDRQCVNRVFSSHRRFPMHALPRRLTQSHPRGARRFVDRVFHSIPSCGVGATSRLLRTDNQYRSKYDAPTQNFP